MSGATNASRALGSASLALARHTEQAREQLERLRPARIVQHDGPDQALRGARETQQIVQVRSIERRLEPAARQIAGPPRDPSEMLGQCKMGDVLHEPADEAQIGERGAHAVPAMQFFELRVEVPRFSDDFLDARTRERVRRLTIRRQPRWQREPPCLVRAQTIVKGCDLIGGTDCEDISAFAAANILREHGRGHCQFARRRFQQVRTTGQNRTRLGEEVQVG